MTEIFNFGDRLKKLCKDNDMPQNKLADKLNISKAMVSRYISGQSYPTFETMRKIATTFSVSMDYLYGTEKISTVSTVGLNTKQIDIVKQLIEELKTARINKEMTEKRNALIGQIMYEFTK